MDQGKEEGEISKVVFDTDVLIWYFRGDQAARELLSGVPYKDRAISALCIMELIQGCLNKKELKTVKEFINLNFPLVIYPDEKISEKAILLLERHVSSDGLRTVDALIAASVLSGSNSIATANYKHFKSIPSLVVLKFEPSRV